MSEVLDEGPFFHGTKADLRVGELLTSGFRFELSTEMVMNDIYSTALRDGAGLAAELAAGDAAPRVYAVEPTGAFEDDPNVTDRVPRQPDPVLPQPRSSEDHRRGDRLDAADPGGAPGMARPTGGDPRRWNGRSSTSQRVAWHIAE